MLRRKIIISIGLALAGLLLSPAAFAEEATLASQQPAFEETALKQSDNETRLRIGPGDPVVGKSKAEMCFGCHGEDGNSVDPLAPKLAGQYGGYITKQIRNYQGSTRSHQVMGSMASTVSDEDIADIAAYFASQPMMKGEHPSTNMLGKKLFENDDLSRMMVRCNSCHGTFGKGVDPGNPVYPVIGGQHKEYLVGQLLNFRKGARNNSQGGVMNITVHRLSNAELDALADYISGL
jgi:cytochrome c553